MTKNINDYSTIPTTAYRKFVDDIQERIAFINRGAPRFAQRGVIEFIGDQPRQYC